jgi:hypothetical protein
MDCSGCPALTLQPVGPVRYLMSIMQKSRLERRPEARAFSVETLLQFVKDGRIRIPEFQRSLKWRTDDVLDFFDSVYRGFPVGELLLSREAAVPKLLHFGKASFQAPARPDALFVVDGQQRITALAGAMLHPDPRPRGDIYAVWFDLEAEQFVRSERTEPPPHWLPVNVAGDSLRLLRWLNDWPYRNERQDLVERAIELGKAVREYQIPAYIVEGASKQDLRLIFKRVNTSGVPLEESEVFDALFGDEAPPISSASERISAETSFEIPTDVFLRTLKLVEGADLRTSVTESEGEGTAGVEAVSRTELALRRTIEFLSEDAGIIHSRLLPYRLPLFVLARFFHLHPRPEPRTRSLLSRWVWRGALVQVHGNSSDAVLNKLRSAIDPRNEYTSVERLLEAVRGDIELPTAVIPWNGRNALTRLCALALVHLSPRSPETGRSFSMDEMRAALSRDESGRVFLDVAGDVNAPVSRRVMLVDRSQMDLLPDAAQEVLASHALDGRCVAALRARDFQEFAERRAELLNPWFHRFFSARAGLGESDRPAVSELVRRVDERATGA